MMNRSYVATRLVRRRGRVWQPGDVLPTLDTMPDWRDRLLAGGAVRPLPAEDGLPEPAALTVDEIRGLVADMDDVEALEALQLSEEAGRGRAGALRAISARLGTLLVPDEDLEDEDEDEEG